MSRRTRALLLFCGAAACAAAALTITSGYGRSVAERYGELRPVIVARAPLPAHREIDPAKAERLIEVRQVPSRFVPPGALPSPGAAIGREPVAAIPTGGYILGPQLRAPRSGREPRAPRVGRGLKPVEVNVSGAEALAALGSNPVGGRVDVAITTEPGIRGRGRTYLAVTGARLLGLRESGGGGEAGPGPGSELWAATLALDRAQALELIEAESFARDVRILPH